MNKVKSVKLEFKWNADGSFGVGAVTFFLGNYQIRIAPEPDGESAKVYVREGVGPETLLGTVDGSNTTLTTTLSVRLPLDLMNLHFDTTREAYALNEKDWADVLPGFTIKDYKVQVYIVDVM